MSAPASPPAQEAQGGRPDESAQGSPGTAFLLVFLGTLLMLGTIVAAWFLGAVLSSLPGPVGTWNFPIVVWLALDAVFLAFGPAIIADGTTLWPVPVGNAREPQLAPPTRSQRLTDAKALGLALYGCCWLAVGLGTPAVELCTAVCVPQPYVLGGVPLAISIVGGAIIAAASAYLGASRRPVRDARASP